MQPPYASAFELLLPQETSQWTLDYPPLFAYFEWTLSHIAALVDSQAVAVSAGPYDSPAFLWFHRASVMLGDCLLAVGVIAFSLSWEAPPNAPVLGASHWRACRAAVLATLTLLNPGLFLVDGMHFQYNSMLLGLLFCVLAAVNARRDTLAAGLFCLLVCSKHLFLVLAPTLAVYFWRHHCQQVEAPTTQVIVQAEGRGGPGKPRQTLPVPVHHAPRGCIVSVLRLATLAALAALLVAASLAPLLLDGRTSLASLLPQMASRLFPFGRGLTHAYWAPNMWALYSAADLALGGTMKVCARLWPGVCTWGVASASATSGLVGHSTFALLPAVPPSVTVLLTLAGQAPAVAHAWRAPHPRLLPGCLVLAQFSAFMLGWHVHEKAALYMVLPAAAMALNSSGEAGWWLLLSAVAAHAQFPLFFTPLEEVTAPLIAWGLWAVGALALLLWHSHRQALTAVRQGLHIPALAGRWLSAGCLGLLPLQGLYWAAPLLLGVQEDGAPRLPFLRLALTSVACAVLLLGLWLGALRTVWRAELREANFASEPVVLKQDSVHSPHKPGTGSHHSASSGPRWR